MADTLSLKYLTQIDMQVPPTEETHLVRLKDMKEYIEANTAESVRAVFNEAVDVTYNSATQTLTLDDDGELVADGVPLGVGDRLIVAGLDDKQYNGVYIVIDAGSASTKAKMKRADNFNESKEISNGTLIPVREGTLHAGSNWKLSAPDTPFTLDTSIIEFNKVIVDVTKVVEFVIELVGDGEETGFEIEHALGTKNIIHELVDEDSGETVIAVFKRIDEDNVGVYFGVAPEDGKKYTLMLHAQVNPV